jgi:DNA-binding beta-propeller fold protein YncE
VLGVRISWRLAVVTAALALAACSSGSTKGGPAASPKPEPARTGPAAILPATTLTSPQFSTATARAPRLPAADVKIARVSGDPFGVAVTPDGRWSFVSSPGGPGGGGIGVFADAGTGVPKLVRTIPAPMALGVALTHDGRYLLAATSTGAVVVSVAQAEDGGSQQVLGTLSNPRTGGLGGPIEVAVSPGDQFAFVSIEYSDEIAVFNLQRALASGFRTSGFVGDIPMGIAPVGMAVSPDGRWMYATSELGSSRGTKGKAVGGQGTLSVISMSKAETDPAHSVVAVAKAGCGPVRVITSADGSVVWVTARESDTLVGFSAARLLTDPSHALVALVRVGEAPVGLALVDSGQRIVVADSNRFGFNGVAANLAVVNVAAALAGKPAVAGYLPAGQFPRQMALEPDGRTLLVTNFLSRQLEAVNVTGLP